MRSNFGNFWRLSTNVVTYNDSGKNVLFTLERRGKLITKYDVNY